MNGTIKINGLNIHVYETGNISITENFLTPDNKQVAYYKIEEKRWYINDGTSQGAHSPVSE